MNRDELHSRGTASPPTVRARDGVRVVAPIDADGGGTWIAANDHGLCVCLLNHYPDAGEPLLRTLDIRPSSNNRTRDDGTRGEPRQAVRSGVPVSGESGGRRSRGHLVLELSSVSSCTEATRRLGTGELGAYRPFLLLALGPRCGPVLHRWDGATLVVIDDPMPPISTSSFDTRRVVGERIRSYEALVAHNASNADGSDGTGSALRSPQSGPEVLLAYHSSHRPERGPYSVCTHREDGATKSLSHVTVSREAVRFAYAPGPPCSTPLGSAVTVPRDPIG